VIEFVLDARSKVNASVQLVRQVKQALQVGLLEPGDQLPKVRDVAQLLAINPNTVLKAYRELEIEGLVEGRPGVGTFVTRSLAGESLARQAELREALVAWLSSARAAGMSAEEVTALVETTMRVCLTDGSTSADVRQPEGKRVNV
jgi:GntR family transcriptional regulator